jgi:hypothetical protein
MKAQLVPLIPSPFLRMINDQQPHLVEQNELNIRDVVLSKHEQKFWIKTAAV